MQRAIEDSMLEQYIAAENYEMVSKILERRDQEEVKQNERQLLKAQKDEFAKY